MTSPPPAGAHRASVWRRLRVRTLAALQPWRAPRPLLVGLGLTLLTLVAYRGSPGNGFVNLDDPEYVTENPIVRAGVTWAGLRWASTAIVVANWHPLTLVSHMVDCALFGLNPRGHHLTSLLLHVGATLLLWEFLRRTTARPWRSAVVAALFAVHPTHVESVAWVAERKDVLCGFLWMATLAAYLHYGRRPGLLRYLLVAAVFALALAAKPMAVTLPFVLLLLDLWPLGRLELRPAAPGDAGGGGSDLAARAESERGPRRVLVPLLLEKLPLLLLSAAAAAMTIHAQGNALAQDAGNPLRLRVANALVAYAGYLRETVVPLHLAVAYPFLFSIPAWRVAASLALLAAITLFALRRLRRAPYLAVGWLWFAGTLVPVSGLVQVGAQRMADRYTYLPSIGLYLATVWGLADLALHPDLRPALRPWIQGALAAATVAALAILTALTMRQTAYWKDSIALFRHSLAVEHSYLAHADLADALGAAGDRAGADAEIRAGIALQPGNPRAHAALGIALQSEGRPREAIAELERSLRLNPAAEAPRFVLALALDDAGESERAIAELREILRRNPRSARARDGLAALLAKRRQRPPGFSLQP